MNIKELKKRKLEMEDNIDVVLINEIGKFQEETGLKVRKVKTYIDDINGILCHHVKIVIDFDM